MICGVDEAGRGPMLGPLVVGAVWCSDDRLLRRLGVKDSKQLSKETREHMYSRIDRDADAWAVEVMDAEEIDRLMSQESLNEIELGMFAKVAGKRSFDTLYADCPDVDAERFGRILSVHIGGGTKVVAEHKADARYPVVSAASIMAKVTRDRIISDISREFGTEVGSGYPSDRTTVEFVQKWIKEHGVAPKHTRCSWAPVKRMLAASHNTSLDDW